MSQAYQQEQKQEQIQTQQQEVQQEQVVRQTAPEQEEVRQQAAQDQALNAQLTTVVHQQLPPAQAVQAAHGAPVQEELPSPTGYKARRREKKHAKIARKACPVGTAITYDLVEGARLSKERKALSARECPQMQTCSSYDRRVLMSFCKGYQKGKLGGMSAQDKANKAADHQLFTDYLTGNLERRRPHLDNMVKELLAIRFTPDMLTVRNVRRNMARYRDIVDKFYAMNDIMKDPVNVPYFNAMDPMTRQALEAAFPLSLAFSAALFTLSNKYGCDLDKGEYISHVQEQNIHQANATLPEFLTDYRQAQAGHQQEEERQIRQSGGDYAARVKQNEDLLRQALADSGVTLALAERRAPWMVKGAALLHVGEEHREENAAVVKMLVQFHQAPGGVPPKDVYYQVKDRLTPRVQRILDCDVNALAALPDSALILHAAELNQMLLDVEMLAELMGTRHHTATPAQTAYLTLGDDLIRYKGPEYAYQASMIQALAQRARALAVGYMTKHGGADAACFIQEEQPLAGGIPAWTERQLAASSQQMEESRTRLHNSALVGQPEYEDRLAQGVKIGKNMANLMDDPLTRVTWEYERSQAPEAQAVRQRLQDENYYSLNYTPQELEARGLPANLSESLFRRFGAFLQSRAAQALLTPETLREMLENLAAGAGLHRTAPMGQDPNEDALKEASQRNAAGMAQLRQVLSAHFRYLERKYGDQLMFLTPEELAEHQADLDADFAFSQVALKLMDNYPDFFAQEIQDLDDLHFRNRLQYYASVGKSVKDMYTILRTAQNREEALTRMKEHWQIAESTPDYAQAYQAIRARHPGFAHPVRWNQGVQ